MNCVSRRNFYVLHWFTTTNNRKPPGSGTEAETEAGEEIWQLKIGWSKVLKIVVIVLCCRLCSVLLRNTILGHTYRNFTSISTCSMSLLVWNYVFINILLFFQKKIFFNWHLRGKSRQKCLIHASYSKTNAKFAFGDQNYP